MRRTQSASSLPYSFGLLMRGTLSRLLVESTVLLTAARTNPAVLRDAASTYKVDTDAIACKVKQELQRRRKQKK